MTTYTDEYLNHYADRFVELGLAELKITLMQYLANPELVELTAAQRRQELEQCDVLVRPQYLTHLEEAYQRRLKVEREIEHLPRRNGVPFQAMHHAHWPRSASAFFKRKTA